MDSTVLRRAALAAAFTVLAGAPRLGAETFTTTTTVDAVDANPGDGVCRTAAGACSLRAAFQEANARPGLDEVVLSPGSYRLVIAGADEDDCRTGDLDVLDDVVFRSASGLPLVDAGRLDRVLDIVSGNATLTAVHLTNGLVADVGGALRVGQGTVDLVDTFVTRSEAVEGGGLAVTGGRLTLTRCFVSANKARDFGAAISSSSDLTLIETSIESNRQQVAGPSVAAVAAAGTLTVRDCFVRGNRLSGQTDGGGFHLLGATASIERTTFRDNAADTGAGLRVQGGYAIVRDCSFEGNRSSLGGGAAFVDGGDVRFVNVTLTGSTAGAVGEAPGGGLLVRSGSAGLFNCTVASNSGSPGGGVRVEGGSLFAQASLFADNVTTTQGADCSGALDSAGYNLIEDAGGCAIGGDTTGNLRGVDPMLGSLADNGGPTLTLALQAGSPAVDAANPAGCTDDLGMPLDADQRGFLRPEDGDGVSVVACDIGAFEVGICGPDLDGDGTGDFCDCLPTDPTTRVVPAEVTLLVQAMSGFRSALLFWTDAAASAGTGTTYDVASDLVSALASAQGASGPCLRQALTAPSTSDSRTVTDDGFYYLVRASNACGPPAGLGWGEDSLGGPRLACP